jgi:hypothetical protein
MLNRWTFCLCFLILSFGGWPCFVHCQASASTNAGLPHTVKYDGGTLQFKQLSNRRAQKWLANVSNDGSSAFALGVFPEEYEPIMDGAKAGFWLHFRDGTSRNFVSEATTAEEETGGNDGGRQKWSYLGHCVAHSMVLLGAEGFDYQGTALVWLSDGRMEWLCAAPNLNATAKWLVSATDFTESGEFGSCLEVHRIDSAEMKAVLDLESDESGFEFLGWRDAQSGILRYWYRTKAGKRVSRCYLLQIVED